MAVHTRTLAGVTTRQERKRRTRQALLEAALELLEEQSFSSLSLRQVTRAAGVVPVRSGVPTAEHATEGATHGWRDEAIG